MKISSVKWQASFLVRQQERKIFLHSKIRVHKKGRIEIGLVTFTEEIIDGKLHFLCSVYPSLIQVDDIFLAFSH